VQAHEAGVNCISWASVNSGNDYFAEDYNDKYAPLPRIATGSCDKTIKIWEYREDSQNKLVEVECLKGDDSHSDWVRDVAWCPSIGAPYEILVSGSEDGTVIFWRNKKSGENKLNKLEEKKCDGPVWRVSWSFSGNLLAVSSAGSNFENIVDVYKENEQGKWEKISKIEDDVANQ